MKIYFSRKVIFSRKMECERTQLITVVKKTSLNANNRKESKEGGEKNEEERITCKRKQRIKVKFRKVHSSSFPLGVGVRSISFPVIRL